MNHSLVSAEEIIVITEDSKEEAEDILLEHKISITFLERMILVSLTVKDNVDSINKRVKKVPKIFNFS